MRAVGEGVHLVNAKPVEISLLYITAANDGDHQTIAGRLATAAGSLPREFDYPFALAGDDNVAIPEGGVKVEQVEEELGALHIAPAEKQGETKSARATRTRYPRELSRTREPAAAKRSTRCRSPALSRST